ncbi:hypothetical protein DFH06DRAFT_699277 [Mycena polygramma]|nr:hypothetical protein DFH06DRAFT_699277 [Mycena polygramma]
MSLRGCVAMFFDLNLPVHHPQASSAQNTSKKNKGKQPQQPVDVSYSPAQIGAIEARLHLLVHRKSPRHLTSTSLPSSRCAHFSHPTRHASSPLLPHLRLGPRPSRRCPGTSACPTYAACQLHRTRSTSTTWPTLPSLALGITMHRSLGLGPPTIRYRAIVCAARASLRDLGSPLHLLVSERSEGRDLPSYLQSASV